MVDMFNEASEFNQNIGSWNVSVVLSVRRMFSNASTFNQDLSSWNAPNVISPYGENIFCNCPVLSTPLFYPILGYTPTWGC
jgi:hypothetical protein